MRIHFEGITIEEFADLWLNTPFAGLDRQVFDKTGLTGKFEIRLEHARGFNPQNVSAPADPSGPSIFTAIQEQLGLKLEPAKGIGYSLIVDSIERPSEN